MYIIKILKQYVLQNVRQGEALGFFAGDSNVYYLFMYQKVNKIFC